MVNGWKNVKLSKICNIIMGQSPNSIYYNLYRKGMPLIQGNADIVNRKTHARNYTRYITKTCDEGDIIMTVRAPVGAIAKAQDKSCIGRGVCALKDGNDFLYHYLIYKEKSWNRSSTGSTFDSINSIELSNTIISLPENIKEQKAIADTLTNMDNLIDSLQRTIEKKEKIFKAATQELLNGKDRVYEWKKVRIGDIGEFTGNGVDKKIRKDEQKIRLLNYMDIMHCNFIYSNVSNYFVTAPNEKINKCSVKKGDIFLTPSSETRLDIGVSSVAMEDIDNLVYSYHIVRFRPIIEMDLLFRAYIFKNQKFLNQASTMCEGSGKRYVCSNKKFASFELEIPIDIREQNNIANKLYVIEKEINTLKNKLQKYKQIKEGMMEDLLTGKVRLNYE